MQVQSNLSIKAIQGTEESGRCWQVAVMYPITVIQS